MRSRGIRGRWPGWSGGMLGLSLASSVAVTGVEAQSSQYLDHEGLTRELRSLVDGSSAAGMRSLGTSREGREIWLVEIGSSGGASLGERPAVLVVGNLEGDHLVGSQLALEAIRHLLTDEAAAPVLESRTVYVVPRLNPDGAEAMFARVKWDRRGNGWAHDDDNDGRVDEDAPEDLNGDGVITFMRVPDPFGDYVVDADDRRLMKEADAAGGESGTHTLYWEGVDSDGDGYYNEDGLGGVDLNRNFQHAYPYWEADAGANMVSEPESRALMDFVVAQRNIASVLTFGHSDNLVTPPNQRGELADAATFDLVRFANASNADIFDSGNFSQGGGGGFAFGGGGSVGARGAPLRGAQAGRDNDPSSGRRPSTTVHRQDVEYFEAVSEAYKEITGISEIAGNREAEGAFFQYGYYHYGVPSFSTPGWGLPEAEPQDDSNGDAGEAAPSRQARERGGEEESLDRKALAAMDAAGIDAFVDWAPYTHPELGEVEIGGFRPYALSNPPAEMLGELGRAHGEFVVRLAGMLAEVRIVNTEVTAHGGGVFTVSAEIENSGFFPTSLQHGVISRSVQPTMVRIQIPPEDVLTGDAKSSTVSKLEGSGSRAKFTWVIQGRAGADIEIWVRSQKGGTDTATVTLR